jgi:ubiquitin-protein ligase
MNWNVTMQLKSDGPYKNAKIILKLNLPENYPY